MEIRDRKYYIERIDKMLSFINLKKALKIEVEKELLSKVKVIFLEEKEFLSNKKNKLNKEKKNYLNIIIEEVNQLDKKLDKDINIYIDEISKFISNKYTLGKATLIIDEPIQKQIEHKLLGYLFRNKVLITKQLNNNEIGCIYDSFINYNQDLANHSIKKNTDWSEITRSKMFKEFPRDIEIVSKKDREDLEFLIKHFQDRFEDLYIITDDNLYNKLELAIIDNPDLLKEENADKLAELINNLKEEYVKENNMTGRLHLEYKED